MQKKTIMLWLFALQINRLKIDGGADGTRTRDPRRDRPVF
jgi:hypothetical protein